MTMTILDALVVATRMPASIKPGEAFPPLWLEAFDVLRERFVEISREFEERQTQVHRARPEEEAKRDGPVRGQEPGA